MIEEMCCCTVLLLIAMVLFFWFFGRVAVIRSGRARAPPPHNTGQQWVGESAGPEDIIMMKCQHCGTRYDERLDRCPGCGGK